MIIIMEYNRNYQAESGRIIARGVFCIILVIYSSVSTELVTSVWATVW
jgi:hypothetical protein